MVDPRARETSYHGGWWKIWWNTDRVLWRSSLQSSSLAQKMRSQRPAAERPQTVALLFYYFIILHETTEVLAISAATAASREAVTNPEPQIS